MPVIAISGGANGIGTGLVERFLKKGCKVATIDIHKKVLEMKDENLLTYVGDISNEYHIAEFFVQIKERFGSLNTIVNNSAIGNFKPFLDLTVDEWRRVIDVNLTGYFLMARFGAPLILDTVGHGSIINIASTRAIMSEPGNEAYSASKAGILGLTHALANSLGPFIRVNAVSPGWILHANEKISEQEHRQHLVGRAGTIDDIYEIVSFLADDEKSGFITGANFVIDGGMTRKMIYI